MYYPWADIGIIMEIGGFFLLLISTPLITKPQKDAPKLLIGEDEISSKFIKVCNRLLPSKKKVKDAFTVGFLFVLLGLFLQLNALQHLYCQFLVC